MATVDFRKLEAQADAIFRELELDPLKLARETDLPKRISPALQQLEGSETGTPPEQRIKGFAQTLSNKILQGTGSEKAQAKFYLAQAILMSRIVEGKSKQDEAISTCEEVKSASNKVADLLPRDQRGLSPLGANGFQQIFSVYTAVNGQTSVISYNALTRGDLNGCQGVLTFLGIQIDQEWHQKFPQLVRNLEK